MAVIAEVQLGAILSRSAHLEKQNKTKNEKEKIYTGACQSPGDEM